jgi:2-polyprenyl-3-methyl-5-hydroxy-6-metoxy-1,4-benzoquinol methylase
VDSDVHLTHVPCDLCGNDDHAVLFVKEGFAHVRCKGCGLVFVSPRVTAHLETQKTGGTGAMGEEMLTPSQVRRLRKELQGIESYRKLNRILEVGAGRGWLLEEAGRQGWETWAVEINIAALERLREKGIHHIVNESAESFVLPEESFDAVRMWDVIEHLQSPKKAVANIYRALRRGGLLRLSTTNFASLSRWVNGPDWVYLNGADHIYLFEPSSITKLLTAAGFSGIRIRTRSFNLRKKRYHPERVLPTGFSLLRPFRKLIDETVRFTPYGHQMIVTAVKD